LATIPLDGEFPAPGAMMRGLLAITSCCRRMAFGVCATGSGGGDIICARNLMELWKISKIPVQDEGRQATYVSLKGSTVKVVSSSWLS